MVTFIHTPWREKKTPRKKKAPAAYFILNIPLRKAVNDNLRVQDGKHVAPLVRSQRGPGNDVPELSKDENDAGGVAGGYFRQLEGSIHGD